MESIERKVSLKLSLLPDQEPLRDPAIHQVARLAAMRAIIDSKGTKPAKRKEANEFFQWELEAYINDGCIRPPAGANGGAAGQVLLRYGRILALSCAIELASSEDTSRRVAKAIRDEAGPLCDAYSDWCSYLLHCMKDSLGQ